jgi:magnesium-transporting ATPase (P-type)
MPYVSVTPQMTKHDLTAVLPERLTAKLEEISFALQTDCNRSHCLVVDGKTLTLVLKGRHRAAFAAVCDAAAAVLCCRMSPLQKAEVVAMVKDFPGSPICAAIGDGANDVAMLQEGRFHDRTDSFEK